MCDSVSQGGSEPLQSQFTDRVSGKSAALLKHFNPPPPPPPIYFQYTKQLTIPAERANDFHCCHIFPLLQAYVNFMSERWGCQLLFCSMRMMSTFLRGPFFCAMQTAKQLTIPAKMPTHHIIYKTTSLLLGSVSRTLESYGGGGVGAEGVMSSFQQGFKSQS